jgi:hypothetical protein
MFEAKLQKASLMKKLIDAIRDLVSDAPFDCSESAMSLQVISLFYSANFAKFFDIISFSEKIRRKDKTSVCTIPIPILIPIPIPIPILS